MDRWLEGVAWLGLLVVLGTVSCGTTSSERMAVSDGWLAMGTFFEADLRVMPADAVAARAWLAWARGEIARLEKIYSRWDPGSEVSALNETLAKGATEVAVGPELADLLDRARSLARETGGAFDVTVAPLVELWSRAAAEDRWPTGMAIRTAGRRVGSRHFEITGGASGSAARWQASIPGLRIDLDGVSKGAVLDRLRDALVAQLPEAAALLAFGQSSVWAIGDPEAEGWRLEIHSRDPERGVIGGVRLRDRALSVSSSLGSIREIDGRAVSHVVDPRSGLAVEGTVEAIVVSDRATEADAWSTALLVLGAASTGSEEPLALVEASEGVEARLIDSQGRSRSTSGWGGATGRARDAAVGEPGTGPD